MKKIDKAYLTKEIVNNLEIEKSVKRHISKIKENNIKEIHKNLLEILEIKNIDDSIYFNFHNFQVLVSEVLEAKKINAEYANYKKSFKDTDEKPLSKKKWLEEKVHKQN